MNLKDAAKKLVRREMRCVNVSQVYILSGGKCRIIIGLVLLKARGGDLISSKDTSQPTLSSTLYQVNHHRPISLNTFTLTERYFVVQRQTAVAA